MNPFYIADHILRIETEHQAHPSRISDSLRRIGDHANLFKRTPHSLTPQQEKQVWKFINEFRSTKQGQAALAQINQAIQRGYRRRT